MASTTEAQDIFDAGNILKSIADSVKATSDIIKGVSDIIPNETRSIVVQVDNLTGRVLTSTGRIIFQEGGFGPTLPQGQILPFRSDVFTFESKGVATGVDGMVTYNAAGIGDFSVAADNPFLGDNSVNVFSNPTVDMFLSIIGVHSSGNHNHARFAVMEKSLQVQSNWRNCKKCQGLFFNGFADNKGRCPAGGGHEMALPAPFDFVLPRDIPPSGHAQADWRNCKKCQGLFFNGFADNKGRCPAGGGHEMALPAPFDFVLLRDIPPSGHAQADWRNCKKCQGLFFNGFADNKGRCPAGGGHEMALPAPFDFVLNHI